MRAQDLVAELTLNASDAMIRNFRAMPEDKRNWKPTPTSRSARNQIWECGMVNGRFAEFLSGTATEPISFQLLGALWAGDSPDSDDVLISKLEAASKELSEVIAALTDERLGEMIEMNPEATIPGKMLMYMGLRNMWYHVGQVNYIQSLYGDCEMH